MDNYFWPWLVSIIVIGVLLLFIILLVVVLKKTLSRVEELIGEVETRIQTLDPAIRVVGEVGEALHSCAASFKKLSESREETRERRREAAEEKCSAIVDAAEWVMAGLSFIQKFRERRRR